MAAATAILVHVNTCGFDFEQTDLSPSAVFQIGLKSIKPFTSHRHTCEFKMAAVAIFDLGV
jgi:hypothetical protein